MEVCSLCGAEFPPVVFVDGRRVDVRGRKRCVRCYAHRPQRRPRKPVHREKKTKSCESCGQPFALRQCIDGKLRYLYNRRFCLDCSPFGAHNTSKYAPPRDPEERRRHKRVRRTQSFLRYQRKRRLARKTALIEERAGRCEDCGYRACVVALEFHHRDSSTKEFGVGGFTGSTLRMRAEAAKCDLLCANCHRLRHAAREVAMDRSEVAEYRQRRKLRAVLHMGGRCEGCGLQAHPWVFEFHHRDARIKDFGLSESGIPHSWDKTVAELAKCVMLCANCHREVHAGVRRIEEETLLGLAEASGS